MTKTDEKLTAKQQKRPAKTKSTFEDRMFNYSMFDLPIEKPKTESGKKTKTINSR
jgi:hypothetical protein